MAIREAGLALPADFVTFTRVYILPTRRFSGTSLLILTQVATIVLVVRDAVGGHDEDARVNFPFSAFLVG